MSDFQFVILEQPGAHVPYCVATDETRAIQRVHALRIENPARFREALYVDFDTFVAEREAFYLEQPIIEITADQFHEALGALPPMAWRTEDGVERFLMSELTHGRITRQYARLGDRYFSAYAAVGAPATYLTQQRLQAHLAALAASPAA